MTDKKEAFRVFDLTEDASRDDIERRYDILLRRLKQLQVEGKDELENGLKVEDINNAYKLLVDDGSSSDQDFRPGLLSPVYKKLNINEKKAQNFFHYHKLHIIVVILISVAIVSMVRSCVTRVDPDFRMAIIGNFYYMETQDIEAMIKEKVPSIKYPNVDLMLLSEDGMQQQDVAVQEKLMVIMAVGDLDLCVLDRNNFEKFAKQGAFLNLDSLAAELGIDKEKNSKYVIKNETDNETHLFGVDIMQSSLVKNIKTAGSDKILAIKVNAKSPSNAQEVFKLLVKQ